MWKGGLPIKEDERWMLRGIKIPGKCDFSKTWHCQISMPKNSGWILGAPEWSNLMKLASPLSRPATQWEHAWSWHLIHKTCSISAMHTLSPLFPKTSAQLPEPSQWGREQCNLQKEKDEYKCLKGLAKAIGTFSTWLLSGGPCKNKNYH